MSNKEFKKETIDMLNVMIQYAEKGPSGFWVEDHEGCGNPEIFSEFAEGLKNGRLIQKQHYLCPWNTAVLYGEGHGNIHTGCYHSCSIRDAFYLSPKMLKAVLSRFRNDLRSGKYDRLDHLKPLLTPGEQAYIRKQQAKEKKQQEQQHQKEQTEKANNAKEILRRYQGNKDIQAVLSAHYGDKIIVMTEDGEINFDPAGMGDIESRNPLSYDDYLDLQIRSRGKQRTWFAMCYYNLPSEFKGRIERKSDRNICFERIFVTGMYPDDCSFFDGKEDHVWMDISGFENFNVGDCVSFFADVYRYVKTSNGKILDYSLRNPKSVQKISPYKLPSDDEIIRQSVNQIICESCFLSDSCNHMQCMRNPKELKALRRQMTNIIKGSKE